jgi:hypothetical protein
MFGLLGDYIARHGEDTANYTTNTITPENVFQLNRILRKEWGIQDVCFEQVSPGVISVVFDRKKYTAAKNLHIEVSDGTILMYYNSRAHQTSMMLQSFTVRVFRVDELLAMTDGDPLPDEADLPDERIVGTDSMEEVVRKTLRVLRDV